MGATLPQQRAGSQGAGDEEGLEGIRASLSTKRGTKNFEKVLERIGRLKERSHGIHRNYDFEVQQKGRIATDTRWSFSRVKEADAAVLGPLLPADQP
ncbi:MAG: hypothetical protein A2177_13805 [Spirochaetes bacterium RBG_13_68_11]|nr:MAG: hypothetical protein A2177_13805 [Spirochaetes bacterium RBG_13_68_11]